MRKNRNPAVAAKPAANGCTVPTARCAVVARLGRRPAPAEYLALHAEKIAPKRAKIYQYLQFDEVS